MQRDSFFSRQQPLKTTENSAKPLRTETVGPNPIPTHISQTHISPVAEERSKSAAKEKDKEVQPMGSQLIVGPNIKMKGVEIADCDTLVVEGHVEATMDSRVIDISASGTFSGTASIDNAEIHGGFSGELTVRHCLTIYSSGKISGKIRYKKLIVEEGGEISGDVMKLIDDEQISRPVTAAFKPLTQPAAAQA